MAIDWKGREINLFETISKVQVTASPFDNLMSTKQAPWPSPEIIQKLFQRGRPPSFDGLSPDWPLGYYCDMQSLHSEDAITWSVFGTLSRFSEDDRSAWIKGFLKLTPFEDSTAEDVEISLWRRVPHPDTNAMGGPEIDVLILTKNIILLLETKWHSNIGRGQGRNGGENQISLRKKFLEKHGEFVFGEKRKRGIVILSLTGNKPEGNPPSDGIHHISWKKICEIKAHPLAEEVINYYNWKLELSSKLSSEDKNSLRCIMSKG